MAKSRPYYTLIVRVPGQLWSPQFGDFDRAVVAQEGDDTKGDWPKGTKMKIIQTASGQAYIQNAVNKINNDIETRRAALMESGK